MTYDVFYMSLLEYNTIRKVWVDENNITELNAGKDSGKYKVKAICNSAVYAKESVGHLPGLYYLVSWKNYLEEKNILEFALAV